MRRISNSLLIISLIKKKTPSAEGSLLLLYLYGTVGALYFLYVRS